MIKTAHAQLVWKIVKLGEEQRRTAKISDVNVAESISVRYFRPK